MAVPVAPAAGEPIAEAWGDVVHDSIVAMDLQSGSATATVTAGTNAANVTVVFSRPFASAPNVIATVGPMVSNVFVCNVVSISATQVVLNALRKDETNQGSSVGIPVQWFAYGPRA